MDFILNQLKVEVRKGKCWVSVGRGMTVELPCDMATKFFEKISKVLKESEPRQRRDLVCQKPR